MWGSLEGRQLKMRGSAGHKEWLEAIAQTFLDYRVWIYIPVFLSLFSHSVFLLYCSHPLSQYQSSYVSPPGLWLGKNLEESTEHEGWQRWHHRWENKGTYAQWGATGLLKSSGFWPLKPDHRVLTWPTCSLANSLSGMMLSWPNRHFLFPTGLPFSCLLDCRDSVLTCKNCSFYI